MDNNKPKIYGHCKAGCEYETVHKEDFEKSASHIEIYADENNIFYLETGKEYKIFAPKNNSNQFTSSVVFAYKNSGVKTTHSFAFTNEDKYADSFVFKLLEAKKVSGQILELVYEIAGVRYWETKIGTSITLLDENYLYVSNVDKVLLYNADATVSGKQGEKGETGATGAKLVKQELIGQDENGGNIYEQTFDDGTTAQFTTPKGEKGDMGAIGMTGAQGVSVTGAVLTEVV